MSILDKLSQGVITRSAKETQALAEELARCLEDEATLALQGNLGTGKTTFVAGLAKAWGITGPVTSPSYNLLGIYRGQRMLAHIDAYRLKRSEDMDDLLIEEFIEAPYCLAIEWPERIEDWLPRDVVWLCFTEAPGNARRIQLRA